MTQSICMHLNRFLSKRVPNRERHVSFPATESFSQAKTAARLGNANNAGSEIIHNSSRRNKQLPVLLFAQACSLASLARRFSAEPSIMSPPFVVARCASIAFAKTLARITIMIIIINQLGPSSLSCWLPFRPAKRKPASDAQRERGDEKSVPQYPRRPLCASSLLMSILALYLTGTTTTTSATRMALARRRQCSIDGQPSRLLISSWPRD